MFGVKLFAPAIQSKSAVYRYTRDKNAPGGLNNRERVFLLAAARNADFV